MRSLALDLGTKTCGFAISDENNIIASALETIYFDEQNFKVVKEQIKKYLKQYQIKNLVLGYPLRSNGAKSERTLMVEAFGQELKTEFNDLDIYLVNEYGTTIQATNVLKEAKLSIKKRNEKKDTLSAVLILQEYENYGGIKL